MSRNSPDTGRTPDEAKIPISVAIPVKNEAAILPRCLERLGRFAEVVVVDSGSDDETAEIATAMGASVVQFRWNGRFPKKRNWTLDQCELSCEWVLFLDADELVDDAFCDAAAIAIRNDSFSGFWLRYHNYFLGSPLRHGVPQRKLALFKRRKGRYEFIDEQAWSHLDMEVHEHPIIEGLIGEISAPIEHRDDRGIARFVDKHGQYAQWEARRATALLREDRKGWGKLTARQKAKYRNLSRGWFPFLYFVYAYVWRLGFLDGSAGFYYAFYKAWYFVSVRLLMREMVR